MNTAISQPDYRALGLLTPEQAHALRVVPFAAHEEGVEFLCDRNEGLPEIQLRLLLGRPVSFLEVSSDELERLLLSNYPFEGTPSGASQPEAASDVVRFVNKMVEEAAAMGASDLHLERYENEARLRFRWEGQLVEKYAIPLSQYNALVSRIKILAELDISERRLPQDGRMHLHLQGEAIDIRVSTLPGRFGEKVVLRLLRRNARQLSLDHLALPGPERQRYQQAIQRPNGIILITGPTGSGKTTTLYATLAHLNRPDRNILTVEDPVEYHLQGINQVQVKPGIGLTFEAALRAFLRQDPDIIMVGEIRDPATASIALRAALTGHLVFSTLHTNGAWEAVTRLLDMGLEPYLLASALRLVAAQRLVRLLCQACCQPSGDRLFPEIQEFLPSPIHFVAKGCAQCYYTGYLGRQAVYEVLPMVDLAERIRESATDISDYLHSCKIPTLRENLLHLAQSGKTSLDEIAHHW